MRDSTQSKGANLKKAEASSIAEILAGMQASTKLGEQLEQARIWQHWPDIAGQKLYQHCRPVAVRDMQLRVEAENNVWMHQVSYRKWQIIRRINVIAGKELVNDLWVSLADEGPEVPSP